METLQHVKNVIATTNVPSWVESVPVNFGDAATGTLKADEWQTLGTIYLPLALISLWGNGCRKASSDYEASCLHAYLDHTMLIVSAMVIACKRTTSERCSNDFLQCITGYLMDLQALHPDANYHPYHHFAMHLPHFFHLFGPACCFWTYPFEQVIGQIQHILSNHQLGQMESTLLHSFLKLSKIKRWLSNPDQPPAIREIKSLFDNIYTSNSDEDGNLMNMSDSITSYQAIQSLLNFSHYLLCPICSLKYLCEPDSNIRVLSLLPTILTKGTVRYTSTLVAIPSWHLSLASLNISTQSRPRPTTFRLPYGWQFLTTTIFLTPS